MNRVIHSIWLWLDSIGVQSESRKKFGRNCISETPSGRRWSEVYQSRSDNDRPARYSPSLPFSLSPSPPQFFPPPLPPSSPALPPIYCSPFPPFLSLSLSSPLSPTRFDPDPFLPSPSLSMSPLRSVFPWKLWLTPSDSDRSKDSRRLVGFWRAKRLKFCLISLSKLVGTLRTPLAPTNCSPLALHLLFSNIRLERPGAKLDHHPQWSPSSMFF